MISKYTDWLVYGAGLSALILAERLGAAGKQVLLVNPVKTWGGIFGGINVSGDIFDSGMTNFEFDLFGESDYNLQSYRSDCKRDVGRFVHYVQRYLSRFVDTSSLPTPSMLFRNQSVGDLIISNQFDVLKLLGLNERQIIRTELEYIVSKPNPLHPRTKDDYDSPLANLPFDQVSIANHGQTFHRLFIEPMFRKVLGVPTSEIEGVFHRNGWAPLFYPETLISQFGPTPQVLKPTTFRYPADANFGAFIGRIEDAVRGLPNVRIIESAKDVKMDLDKSIMFVNDDVISFGRLAWGGDLSQLAEPLAEAQTASHRASIDLFFLKVRDEGVSNRFTVLIDPEVESPFYRVTNQSICSGEKSDLHKIILECNSSNWIAEAPDSQALLNDALRRYKINPIAVESCHRRSFRNALTIPSTFHKDEFNRRHQIVSKKFPEVELIGPSSGYVSVTLNDHIIQALKISQKQGVLG